MTDIVESGVGVPLTLELFSDAGVARLVALSDAALRLHLGAWFGDEELESLLDRLSALRHCVAKRDVQ